MQTGLCRYRDMFGKVGEGAHSYRILNIAVVDVALTLLAAFLVWWFWLPTIALWKVTAGFFVTGIVMHRLFCVRTTVDKFLFG